MKKKLDKEMFIYSWVCFLVSVFLVFAYNYKLNNIWLSILLGAISFPLVFKFLWLPGFVFYGLFYDLVWKIMLKPIFGGR